MKSKSPRPPKGKLGRSKIIGTVASKVAGKKLVFEAKSLFASKDERESQRLRAHEEIAATIFAGLSQLRGTALKLAQLFCGESGLLNESYMKAFEQAHYRVPPLSAALVRSLLRREWRRDPDTVLADFNWQAVAAASLGQVHRGRLKSGEAVAIKVQYPGIGESILSDFSLARRMLKPFRQEAGLILGILDELEVRLQNEVNYLTEVENLKKLAGLALPARLRLPKAYEHLTTRHVLVLDFVSGLHLDTWLATKPNQTARNQVAEALWSFFVHSVFSWKVLHADPNLGNYLIDNSSQVWVLDFGAVKDLGSDDVEFYRKLWTTSPEGSLNAMLSAYAARGAEVMSGGVEANQELLNSAILPYLRWVQEFLNSDTYNFTTESQFVQQGHDLFLGQLFNPHMQNFSAGLTLVHRTLLGLLVIFHRLQARAPIRPYRHLWAP